MDKTKLAKYTTAAVMTTGMAITLPAIAPFVAPFILPLMSGILSESTAADIGKSGVDAIKGILGNLASSAIWESPNPLGKNPENQDLLRLLANAYLEAIKKLDIDDSLKEQADIILPLVRARLQKAVGTKKEVDLLELFPLNKDSQPGDLRYSFANHISSGEIILKMADESFSEDEIFADEIEISIRRWFSEEKTFQNQTATDLTTINLSTESIPEPLRSFLRERLAKSIPQKIGELLKQPELERSWIAFQRSHLQAILKEVQNNKRLSGEDRELLRPLAEILDRFSKLEGVPEKLTELSENCLKRFDNIETILENNQAELLKAIDEGEKRLSEKIEDLRQQNLDLKIEVSKNIELLELINTNIVAGNESLNVIKNDFNQGKDFIERLRTKFSEQNALIKLLLAKFGDNGTFTGIVSTLNKLSNNNVDLSQQIDESNLRLQEAFSSGIEKVLTELGKTKDEIIKEIRRLTYSPPLPNSIPPISGFVGRKDYLDDLRESYQNGTRCFVLHGIGGVGKTALALEFASAIAGEYAAKIFVDMQGMSDNPLSWQAAMFEVVRQFKREVPAEISEAQMVTHYVQFAQNQPTLIVLDNAANKESVERLMRAKACLIVTSRESFALTDGKSKPIFQMSPADARNLLFKNAGGEKRFDGRADELANLAGYLPMALKPLAALLATDELETAADLIEKYLDKKELLKERVPDYENRTVEASFELSYEVLSAEMKERWRRLSVFPSDFDEGAIAAILEIPADEAKETQKQLRRFSLLELNSETRRFNLHDLIRAFSRTKPSAEERVKTQLLYSKYYASILQRAAEIQSNDSVNGFVDASKLIDSELKNIVIGLNWAAHFTDQNNFIAELCWAYSNFSAELLILRLHPRTFTAWQQVGLRAARKLENKQYEGSSLGNLGVAYNNLGEYRNSIMCSEQSIAISRETNDRQSEGISLGNLGLAYIGLGELEKAIEYSEQSLAIAREINNRESEEANLTNLGNSYYGLGMYRIAMGYHEQSLEIARQNSDRPSEAQSLGNLGNIYHALGDYKEAINYQEQSLAIKREISDRHGEGISLGNLGLTFFNLGNKEKACVLWKESVAILEAIESPSTNVFRQLIEANCS
jgi:tetratricopeptide (TPR) repeat protein